MIDSYTNNNQELPSSPCNRCKSKPTEMICNECSPYSNFCSNCDNYIHSLPSKRSHKRISYHQPLIQSTSQYQRDFSPNISQENTKAPFTSSESLTSPQSVSQNYINEIKKIYETEKEELINKNFILEKKLNANTASMSERIHSLTHQLEEQSTNRDMDLRQISDTHQMELQRVIGEKDNQLQYLYAKNFELEKSNDELMCKLNQYADLLNENKISFNDQLMSSNSRVHNLERDLAELKDFYETKLGYFTKNFSNEKNKIIESYEVTIDKLTSGYNDSKGKYTSVINQREEEIKGLIMSNRNEVNNLNATIEQLKQTVASLQCDQDKLIVMNGEQKSEIEILKRTIEGMRKEMQYANMEKRKVEKESESIAKNMEQLRVQNEKMHRLTHGKLKK